MAADAQQRTRVGRWRCHAAIVRPLVPGPRASAQPLRAQRCKCGVGCAAGQGARQDLRAAAGQCPALAAVAEVQPHPGQRAGADERQAVAGVFSVMRNVSVPWGVGDPEHPNLSPTYWRSVADSTNRIYYFESALSPNIVWVNLNKVNLGPGSGIRAVKVEENYSIIGNIDDQLASAEPIAFLAPTATNQPSVTAPSAPQVENAPLVDNKVSFRWWWLIPIFALLGLLGFLPRLFRKQNLS